jgi:hypothetical protein
MDRMVQFHLYCSRRVTLREFAGAKPGTLAVGSATPRAGPIPMELQPGGKKGYRYFCIYNRERDSLGERFLHFFSEKVDCI